MDDNKYYILDCVTDYPVSSSRGEKEFRTYYLTDGYLSSKPIDVPIRCTLDLGYGPEDEDIEDKPGIIRPFYGPSIPLMRNDLLKAILEAGVDNLQIYPALLIDTCNNIEYKNYYAINVIGTIRCADKGKSKMLGLDTMGGVLHDMFDSLEIEGRKPDGVLMFRLAENTSAILVHAKVRRYIEKHKIPYMEFIETSKWSG